MGVKGAFLQLKFPELSEIYICLGKFQIKSWRMDDGQYVWLGYYTDYIKRLNSCTRYLTKIQKNTT